MNSLEKTWLAQQVNRMSPVGMINDGLKTKLFD